MVSTIYQSDNTTTEGASYIHNKQGTFYLAISAANLVSYTIIIEQDADSIPETFGIWILIASSTAVVGAILVQRYNKGDIL